MKLEEVYKKHEPSKVGFVVARRATPLGGNFYTVDFDEALQILKEKNQEKEEFHLYAYTLKAVAEYFKFSRLFDDLLINLEDEGIDSDWFMSCLNSKDIERFREFANEWITDVASALYVADELIGELDDK